MGVVEPSFENAQYKNQVGQLVREFPNRDKGDYMLIVGRGEKFIASFPVYKKQIRHVKEEAVSLVSCLSAEYEENDAEATMVQNDDCFTISGFLLTEESERLIVATEELTYEEIPYPKEYRSNFRRIVKDAKMAEALWPRMRRFVPRTRTVVSTEHPFKNGLWEAVGL